MKIKKHSAFTLIELLVVISIIAVLAGFALPAFANAQKKGKLTRSLSDAKQIGLALKMYAGDHDSIFPRYTDPDEPTNKLATSNAALSTLMPKYIQGKAIFINKVSKWCDGAGGSSSGNDQNKLLSKECDWSYVRGLTEQSNTLWPILATAFADAQGNYVKGTSKKGGVWDGTDAVVVNVDGSGRIVSSDGGGLVKEGEGYIVGRPDKKKENAFKSSSDWLDGDDIQVLMPEG